MVLIYRSLAWLFSRLADFLHRWPSLALAIMMTFGTLLCFIMAIGARSVVLEPTIPQDKPDARCGAGRVAGDHS
jgi:hypothetical protein